MNRFAAQISSRPHALPVLAAAAILSAAALLGSPTVATAAQPAVEVHQATLYYSPRDLSSEQGSRALYRRLVTAAQAVCPGWDSRDLYEVAASRACQRDALARAIGQIGNARLAVVHAHALARRG